MTTAPAIRDAASVVLVRRDGPLRVLMGMRGAQAAFMPWKYVFPGGAVDAEDHLVGPDLPGLLNIDSACTAAAIVQCARRELTEETGLRLSPQGSLHFFFRAITPPGRPRRFDARFLLADAAEIVGDPDDLSMACDELSHLHWVQLQDARSLDLPFITEVILAEVASLIATFDTRPLQQPASVPFFDNRLQPRFERLGG